MTNYLLHQKRDGTPIGVWTETSHYYDTRNKQHEAYGQNVVAAKGSETEWEDYTEQLASKTPTPTAMWDLYDHPEAELPTVLQDARNSLEDA